MVDALVSTVIRKLDVIYQKEIKQEVRLVVGVKKDVHHLSRTFTKIRAVLEDAEERKIKDSSVGRWLQKLKDVTYDIDDVLDEWSTEILKSQIEGVDDASISLTKKVCPSNLISPCFCFKGLGLHHDIGHRVKEIKERLSDIASEKDLFRFREPTTKKIINESSRSLETSSFVDVSEVFGRDEDRNIIITKLLNEGSQQEGVFGLSLISIVGMSGVGKTTLAQLAFNDDKVKNYFGKRVWVHASKSFDKVKVAMHIIREFCGNIDTQGHDMAWEALHNQLTSSVYGKHFLLVLDDVWIEDPMEWDSLRLLLKCSSQRRGIIVTTRNERVATMMGTTYVHRLGILSDEACWSLLRRYAFAGRQEDECEKLKEISMQFAKKCNGFPLSTKMLGSLLCFKKSKQDWQHMLSSEVWNGLFYFDKPVLPALLLCYEDLPSPLKQCLVYCSLVPRIYRIDKWSMTRQWMAQGFLSEDWDTVGDVYFNNLLMRTFFQKDVKYSRGSLESYEMHDLVHDFAKSLVENECFTLSIKDTNAEEVNISRARHLYLLMEDTSTIPSFIYKAKNLRTLKIYGQIPSVSSQLFHHLTCLRTLDLGFTYLEVVPNEIEKLMHLRFLNLACGRFKKLPKTVTSLYNLQVLHLADCGNLCELPKGFGRLVNLTDLDLTKCHQLSYLPEGIGRLSKLRRLSYFIDGRERGGCKIGELKDLNLLKGSLPIIGLGRVEKRNEAEMACLENKQHLYALYFYFNQCTGVSLVDKDVVEVEEEEEEEVAAAAATEIAGGDDTLSKRMENVLEGLQPHPNLVKLIIRDYLGAMFPDWMRSYKNFLTFSNLVFLEFWGCRKCEQLPPTVAKLPSLETLVIAGMDEVKFMGVDFFASDLNKRIGSERESEIHTILFPKLKVFQLSWMCNLEKWNWEVTVQEEKHGKKFIFMPSLEHLVLGALPKLRLFPHHLAQVVSLQKLFIWDCPNLTWSPPRHIEELMSVVPNNPNLTGMRYALSKLPFLNVEELILKKDAGSFSTSFVHDNQMILPKLKLLSVRQSPYSLFPEGLGQLTSLEILDIRCCSNIMSIPEGELQHLIALEVLTIKRCPALRQRCQKDIGEDWIKIRHIPKIIIDGEKIK